LKKFYFPLLMAVLVLVIACGGGGGGGGTGGTSATSGSTGTLNPIRVEGVLASNPAQIVDLQNVQVGDVVQLQIVGYDSNRQRVVLSSGSWTTNDGTGAGTLSSSGLYTATKSTGGTAFTFTGSNGGKLYSANYQVKPVQALVTGSVMDSNGAASSRIVLVLYNATGTVMARGTTASDGTFRISTPITAKRFNLDPASMSTTFYFRSFVYQSKRYTALISSCTAPLPTLTNGSTSAIGFIVIDAAQSGGAINPPPPPPDGCPTS
jgi:hypothetical protein